MRSEGQRRRKEQDIIETDRRKVVTTHSSAVFLDDRQKQLDIQSYRLQYRKLHCKSGTCAMHDPLLWLTFRTKMLPALWYSKFPVK